MYLTVAELEQYCIKQIPEEKKNVLIKHASTLIDGYCQRKLIVEEYSERLSLNSNGYAHLTYYPVVEVNSLKGKPSPTAVSFGVPVGFWGPVQWEDIASFYDLDKKTGTIWVPAVTVPYTEIEIEYTSGYETIPEDIKQVCGMLVGSLWQRQDYTTTIYIADPMASRRLEKSGYITDEMKLILDKYRVRGVR